MSQWWGYVLLIAALAIGYLLSTLLDRKYKIFKKIPSWVVIPLPFVMLLLIALPMVLVEPRIEADTIFYSAGVPTCLLFGWSTALFIERWNVWKEKKLAKAQEARGMQPTQELTKKELKTLNKIKQNKEKENK